MSKLKIEMREGDQKIVSDESDMIVIGMRKPNGVQFVLCGEADEAEFVMTVAALLKGLHTARAEETVIGIDAFLRETVSEMAEKLKEMRTHVVH